MTTIKDLNLAEPSQAYRLVEPLIERAPSVAEQVILRRPFTGVTHLIDTITDTLFTLTSTERVGLFKGHPELAPNNPLAMTKASQSEQARLELVSRDNEYQVRLTKMNAAYQERFGFPFITALVGHNSMETVIVEFVPTFVEQGYDIVIENWVGLSGPAGIDAAMTSKINETVLAVLANPVVQARLTELGISHRAMPSEEYAGFVADQIEIWEPLIKAAGIVE